ncbi:MAG: YggT family protein [Eubacteriales bacterium]|nr:YggT family protein [Eubacteriales bacterium]
MQTLTTLTHYIFEITLWAINAYATVIVLSALCSWFLPPYNRFMRLLNRVTDPILSPFRLLQSRLFTTGMRMDFSPVFAIIALQIVSRLLVMLYGWLF